MFRHELFHIRQRHTWDVVFMEIVTSFLWINPFFHLVKKELRTIHEFLADEFATKENDKWTYAELLVRQLHRSSQHSLANHFFHNQIKRRIAMITSSTTPKYQFFRKLMILPIATLILIAFAFKVQSDSATDIPKTSRHIEKPLPADNVLIGRLTRSDQYTSDTARPRAKEKQKRKERREKDEVRQNEEGAEQKELKDLLEQKQQEAQKTQQELKELLIEKQKETEKEQLEFKDMMEQKQHEAKQKGNELFKKLMAEKQIEAQKAGDEFKRMMEEKRAASEREGQEKFKQLMAEKQLEAR